MIDDKMPVFVCKRCGNIIRSVAYEENDVYNCRICNFEMTKGNKNIVSSIKFQDFYERVTPKSRKDKKTFEFEISMSDFRKLIMKLATTISELDKA